MSFLFIKNNTRLFLSKIIGLFFLLSFFSSHAQQEEIIDSLLLVLNKSADDTSKVNVLCELAWDNKDNKPELALEYAEKALKLSGEINFNKGAASSCNTIGIIYYTHGNYDKALVFYFKSLSIFENTGNKKGIAGSYNNIANAYSSYGNNAKALEFYLKSLNSYKVLAEKTGIASCYMNIGSVYFSDKEYEKALEYYLKSLKFYEEPGYKQELALCYLNIGGIYYARADYYIAVEYYTKSLKIVKELGDKPSMASSYNNIGLAFMAQNRYTEAKSQFALALNMAKEVGNNENLRLAYFYLSKCDSIEGDFINAFLHQKLYAQINDTIYNKESSEQIADMQIKYETGEKEKEIELQNLKISEQETKLHQKTIIQIVLVAVIILVLIIVTLAYYFIRLKSREKIKSALLMQQELQTKAIIDVQEQERDRIACSLHDGIGLTLTGIIAKMEQLDKNGISDDNEKQKIIRLSTLALHDAHKEIRTLSHHMMPRAIKEMGLASAIADLLEKTLVNSNIKYNFDTHGIKDIPENTAINLYRIFQELLGNVLKHSDAAEVSVQLFKNKDMLIMIVEDDGIGINSASTQQGGITQKKDGIGLMNIAGRVHVMNGSFTLEPGPVKGTVATVRIPL